LKNEKWFVWSIKADIDMNSFVTQCDFSVPRCLVSSVEEAAGKHWPSSCYARISLVNVDLVTKKLEILLLGDEKGFRGRMALWARQGVEFSSEKVSCCFPTAVSLARSANGKHKSLQGWHILRANSLSLKCCWGVSVNIFIALRRKVPSINSQTRCSRVNEIDTICLSRPRLTADDGKLICFGQTTLRLN
jgi:hypothetical protein